MHVQVKGPGNGMYRSKEHGLTLAVKGRGQKKPWDKDSNSTLLLHVQVKGAGYNVSCQRTGPEEAMGQGQGQYTLNACTGQRSGV